MDGQSAALEGLLVRLPSGVCFCEIEREVGVVPFQIGAAHQCPAADDIKGVTDDDAVMAGTAFGQLWQSVPRFISHVIACRSLAGPEILLVTHGVLCRHATDTDDAFFRSHERGSLSRFIFGERFPRGHASLPVEEVSVDLVAIVLMPRAAVTAVDVHAARLRRRSAKAGDRQRQVRWSLRQSSRGEGEEKERKFHGTTKMCGDITSADGHLR